MNFIDVLVLNEVAAFVRSAIDNGEKILLDRIRKRILQIGAEISIHRVKLEDADLSFDEHLGEHIPGGNRIDVSGAQNQGDPPLMIWPLVETCASFVHLAFAQAYGHMH